VKTISPRGEKVAAVALWTFSLIYFFSSLRLKLGRMANPGSGFMPLLVGICLLLCATIYLAQVFRAGRERTGAASPPANGRNYWVPMGIGACVVVYPFLLGALDFLLATFLVVAPILVILKFKNLAVSLLTAALITVLAYFIFARVLGVVLPNGILEQFLLSL
jgi:hypothetical protein